MILSKNMLSKKIPSTILDVAKLLNNPSLKTFFKNPTNSS